MVTQEQFASLPVKAAVAHAGPTVGVLPVHMDLIAYAESESQTLSTTILGQPVQVRATPVSYHWDFGDGKSLTTSTPGRPYPAKDVTSTYEHQGWYDITLTTTYSGQFSVAGGPWQDVAGTIDVSSEPIEIYSRSYESRLVNPDKNTADDDFTPPRRGAKTEGRRSS